MDKVLEYLKKNSDSKTNVDLLNYIERLAGFMRKQVRKEVCSKTKELKTDK